MKTVVSGSVVTSSVVVVVTVYGVVDITPIGSVPFVVEMDVVGRVVLLSCGPEVTVVIIVGFVVPSVETVVIIVVAVGVDSSTMRVVVSVITAGIGQTFDKICKVQ